MACSQSDIDNEAKGLSIDSCVVAAFCNQYGRLPANIPELQQWGDQTGYRKNGAWQCNPSTPASPPSGGTAPSGGSAPSGGTTSGGSSGGSFDLNSIFQNPIPLGIGLVIGLLIGGR